MSLVKKKLKKMKLINVFFQDSSYSYVHKIVGFVDIVDEEWATDQLPTESKEEKKKKNFRFNIIQVYFQM